MEHLFFGRLVRTLTSLIFAAACLASATPMFFGTNSGSSGGGSSITIDSNWGNSLSNRTITVPAGNPGTIKFTGVSCDVTCQYSKNNAAYVNFVSNDTLSVATSDVLKMKDSTTAGINVTVIDNTTSSVVGTLSF